MGAVRIGILGFAHAHVDIYCESWRRQPQLGAQVVAGWVTPGHLTMSGSRMPPSYSHPLPPRSGTFEVGDPSAVERPPLSDMKMTAVRSAMPNSSSFFVIRPTLSSMLCTIAA